MFGKKKPLSDIEKKAKLAVLKDAHGMANDSLKSQLSGLKKVSVASNTKEGLKEGLHKAEDLISGSKADDKGPYEAQAKHNPFGGSKEIEAAPADDSATESEDDAAHEDSEPKDVQEIEDMIAHLMELKQKLEAKA